MSNISKCTNKVKLVNNNVLLKNKLVSKFISENIKIPDFQRNCDKQKVLDIIEYQSRLFAHHNMYQFSSPIILCLFENQYWVADGQHRYYAMKQLYNNTNIDFEVLISVNEMSSEEEMKEFFININKGSNVSDWHLNAIVNKDPRIKMYKDVQEYISTNYKNFLSQAKRPQKPNINLDIFFSYLCDINYFEDCATKTEAVMKIENENQSHYQELLEDPTVSHLLTKCYSKKNKSGDSFFLGIHWVYKDKVKISQSLRQVVWNKYAGEGVGNIKCPVCEVNTIDPFTFDAGHIIARANGGLTVPKNLRPICKSCNKSMAVQHIDEYKRCSF